MPSGSRKRRRIPGPSRRTFIGGTGAAVAGAVIAPEFAAAEPAEAHELVDVRLTVNGRPQHLRVDPRATLLDTLRERLDLTGTKKGCDRGQCGACTVHVDGRRVVACLTLTAMLDGQQITTIEGLAREGELHPMQQAFIDHDGFQCGFCTPGQIMSAVALVDEGHAGTDDAIREYMSGNVCRCSAYPGIRAAIKDAKKEMR
ncbi:(2Fe-2S)-binding domain protein [Streptomyces davaonensis JCM 4913]|uniref:(2Fe-2S)-binding domain protein n=1 Tax=Streptomyces davaonensis (strain DSM 101723 / JCM 4913 / KCC S-0913 / 768) TaxID=1214101 RepID=K4QYN6_STRDJ|nr:(2Fe-2S)-binding protein [Streptomyces davaonensis]CCK26037.1 (2Fe-2S)-binding domain protein [Streptomyces davaonensis JCM 4913]